MDLPTNEPNAQFTMQRNFESYFKEFASNLSANSQDGQKLEVRVEMPGSGNSYTFFENMDLKLKPLRLGFATGFFSIRLSKN